MRTSYKSFALICLVYIVLSSGCSNHKTASIAFSKGPNKFYIKENGYFLADFEFKNSGSDSLKIEKVTASCGCTSIEYPRKRIGPGEYGHIKIKYNNSLDNSQLGEVRKLILVKSNTNPILHTLDLQGVVNK
jgi:hypothetical protein